MGGCACMCAVMHGVAVDVRPQEILKDWVSYFVYVTACMHMCEAPSYST